ncbi:MAG: hypothetical protein AAFV25_24050 [Bacteroidota bacterium]
MSEQVNDTSIQPPETALDPAMNYQTLRSIGLDTIIQTGSEQWTDYNEHDPGITILESIIFSLTDLAYRTDFPIEDIIAQQELSQEQLARQQFYTARNILSNNPLTFVDFRKLLADQKGVGSAWVEVADDPLNTLGGMVDILIDPYPELSNVVEKKEIIQSV